MKKTYEKPQIYMERFELAEHIAGCSLEWNLEDQGVCTLTLEGDISGVGHIVLFTPGVTTSTCEASGESYCSTNGSLNLATINS